VLHAPSRPRDRPRGSRVAVPGREERCRARAGDDVQQRARDLPVRQVRRSPRGHHGGHRERRGAADRAGRSAGVAAAGVVEDVAGSNVEGRMAEPTALVMHPDCARHDTGWGHPEHQGRLPAVVNALYMDTPALLNVVRQVEAEPASPEALLRVHTGAHVERVRAAVDQAARSGRQVALDPDTIVSDASWDAALAAAGCAITATALVLDGETRTAFAVCRPPGHHATPDRAMGFCLFNNVAVAARWAQAERGVERVLIVDWDVHHGNGTQDIFYEDPSVYFISLHMSPHWPGTSGADEIGAGAGKGTTRNVPLPPGTGPEV